MNKQKPNFILINCDDLGYGDLGCYGSTINHTPVIDQMAASGLVCTDWYSPSPVCTPSRGALMTGCYPPRIGFGEFDGGVVLSPGHRQGLNTSEMTLAKSLKQAGYYTALVGKWHCGDQPEFLPSQHGFDFYYGLPYSNDMGRQKGLVEFYQKHFGITRTFPPLPLILNDSVIEQQPDQASLTERYTEQAVRLIRENKDQPFFLYFAHMHVHLPHYAQPFFLDQSENGDFGACMATVDWSVAVLLHELKQQGILEQTVIVFTSDNGSLNAYGASNGELRGKKRTTWEGGQRVPCIWYQEGTIKPGSYSREVMSHLDFLPTFTRLAGLEPTWEQPIDGSDLTDVIFQGKERTEAENTFYYYLKNDLEAIRIGRWKLHFAKDREPIHALYDLESDVSETKNIIDDHPEIARHLKQKADQMRLMIGDDLTGIKGEACRPCGSVDNPKPLAVYDPDHPYIIAEYDKEEIG